MSAAAVIEVWTDVQYATGAQRLAVNAVPWTGTEERTIAPGQPERLSATAPWADPAAQALGRDVALRVTRGDAVAWYRVADLVDADGAAAGGVRFIADPILHDLGARGLVRVDGSYSISAARLTPAQVLSSYVLPDLAAVGLAHWSLGTVDPVAPLEEITFARWTRLQVLRWVEEQTGAVARVRDTGTGLALDLRRDPNADADPLLLAVGGGVASITRTRRATDRATDVLPLGLTPTGADDPATLAEAAFEISAIAGSVVTLIDPDDGRAMVRNGVDLTGARLLATDGTLVEITATDAAAGTVTVASAAALSVGDIVGIRADASGALLESVSTGATPARVRVVALPSARGERNYVPNPLFADWSSVSAPADWSEQPSTYRVGEFPRDETIDLTTGAYEVHGNYASGVSGYSIRGLPPGARLYAGELVRGGTPSFTSNLVSNVVAVANGSGVITPVFTANTTVALNDGDPVTILAARPDGFPEEAFTNPAAKLMDGNVAGDPPAGTVQRLQSAAFAVPYLAGPYATVRVAAAFTMVVRTGSLLRTPYVLLRNNGTGAVLAWAKATTLPSAGETTHETVTASYALSAPTTVDVCLTGGDASNTYANFCRWVMVWLGPSTLPPETPFSMANALWHRGLDELGCSCATGASSFAVQLSDLDPASVALGQPARLISDRLGIDRTGTIVGIRWNLADPRRSQVIVDRAVAPLTRLVRG